MAKLAGGASDQTLIDALVQRRTLIQQAVRQAELSIRQMPTLSPRGGMPVIVRER